MTSIAELAAELHITRQRVHALLRQLAIEPTTKGGAFMLTATQVTAVRHRHRNPPKGGRPRKGIDTRQ